MGADINYSCCFFGHRDKAMLDVSKKLKCEIEKLITEKNVKKFYFGGYGNFDKLAALNTKELKGIYNNLEMIYIPAYLSALKAHKDYIQTMFDYTLYPDGLEFVPKKFAILKRNDWIINQCKYGIFYITHDYGGAYMSFEKAKRAGMNIINLAEF